jgi:hypothetical protein
MALPRVHRYTSAKQNYRYRQAKIYFYYFSGFDSIKWGSRNSPPIGMAI